MINEDKEVEEYFRKAAGYINPEGYTQEELYKEQFIRGVREFKRAINLDSFLPDFLTLFTPFALFGAKKTKSLGKIIKALQKTGMISSEEEGKNLVDKMIKVGSIYYIALFDIKKRIKIEKDKKNLYKISCKWVSIY